MIQFAVCVKKRSLWCWFCGCCIVMCIRLLTQAYTLATISSHACENGSQSRLCLVHGSPVRRRRHATSVVQNSTRQNVNASIQQDVAIQDVVSTSSSSSSRSRCAFNFFGLPRAFKHMVLPSLIAKVIIPNAQYDCDYFVHFYNVTYEPPSRSGKGGIIVPDDVYLLRQAVHDEALRIGRPLPHVGFTLESVDAFEKNQSDILRQIRKKYPKGRNPFFGPQKSFTVVTYVNVIKMWYSIAAAWESMEKHASSNGIKYERIAMMRSDVVYLTPIDIFRSAPSNSSSENRFDEFNNQSVIPGFARFPVNDRMFYGPYEAAEIWATGRFSRLEDFVYRNHRPLNSEQFLAAMIMPAIRERAISVGVDPGICFLRARADGSVWNDCHQGSSQIKLERLLNISCRGAPNFTTGVPILRCSMKAAGILT
jgi:hypothetical protein